MKSGLRNHLGVVVVMGMSVLAMACGSGEKATSDTTKAADSAAASSMPAAPDPPYDHIGEGNGAHCSVTATDPADTWCKGFFGKSFDVADNAVTLGKAVHDLGTTGVWKPWSPLIDRVPAVATDPYPQWKIQTLASPRRVPIMELKAEGVIVARIEVAAGSKKDNRYGIWDDPSLERGYYLVATNYNVGADDGYSRPVATLKIYGIVKSGFKLVNVGNTVDLRWCKQKHGHGQKRDGATFLTCKSAHELMALDSLVSDASDWSVLDSVRVALGPRKPAGYDTTAIRTAVTSVLNKANKSKAMAAPLTSAVLALIKQLLDEDPTDPAWMTCGVGCCTAGT